MTRVFLILSVILNLFLGLLFIQSQAPAEKLYIVYDVIDGDTIVVDNQQTIRLMSVNAPELSLCGGRQAKEEMESLVLGKQIKLVGSQNDHYSRLLALVYLPDGTLINESIIRSGWARFTSTASVESARLQKAFQETKAKKIGIFSPLCAQTSNPKNPKCSIKGNIKDGNKTYFFQGCGNYSNVALALDEGDRWFCSEAEAVSAGFVKALNCYDKKF